MERLTKVVIGPSAVISDPSLGNHPAELSTPTALLVYFFK